MTVAVENILFELICYGVFVSVCASLLQFRCSKKRGVLVLATSVAVAAVIQLILLLSASNAAELVLTMLPITAYLPVIVTVHILAKGGFAAAVAVWSIGLLTSYILNLFRNLIRELWTRGTVQSVYLPLVLLGSLILGALLVFAALRLCRKPFQMYEFRDQYIWLIIPVALLFLLISFLQSMAFDPSINILLFLIVLSMFAFLIKFLNVVMSEQIAEASEREIARQLDAQRQELLRIDEKMEQDRIYRHDMRHHLSVLHDLAEREKTADIQEYISSLDSRISDLETKRYCDNTAVNAVLSTYLGQAQQAKIRIEMKVDIPKKLPVDAFDICTILANALSNAVTACCACQENRWIYLSCALHENGNFSVDLKNSCQTPVEFGQDGLPVSHGGEGHGFGIKSIESIVRKYNGLLHCTCEDGMFRLSAVLFSLDNMPPAEEPFSIKRTASNAAFSALLAICLLNFLPGTMQAAAAVPVVGDAIRMIDIRNYRSTFSWGASGLEIDSPQFTAPPAPTQGIAADESLPPDLSGGIHEMNRQIDEYIEDIQSQFLYFFSRKYQGCAASDTGYTVLRNDEELLSIQFYTTIGLGGSGEYSRCFTLDMTSGALLELADLFAQGSDYVGIISADILRQMEEQVAAGQADYFIPGGIFPDEACFQAIDDEQNFYIDEDGKLVIVFDEYEVAPGSAGMPHFTIEPEVLDGILRQPSLLSQVGKETA